VGINKTKVVRLLAAIEDKRDEPAPTPKLDVAGKQAESVIQEGPARTAMLKRITDLKRMYRLGWLVNQETFTIGTIYDLDDAAIACLLKRMERAIECPVDDVSYEDAGLVKNCIAI
jgi:hypothetical protein